MVCQISSSYILHFKSRRHWSCMRMHCKASKEQPPRQPDVCTCKHEKIRKSYASGSHLKHCNKEGPTPTATSVQLCNPILSYPILSYRHKGSNSEPPETSGALDCLSILQTVVTRLQTPCQKQQSPSGPRLIPSPRHGSDLGRIMDPPKYFQFPIPHRGTLEGLNSLRLIVHSETRVLVFACCSS
eukprot:1157154-Pelagomonas_calceolata.AAC.1